MTIKSKIFLLNREFEKLSLTVKLNLKKVFKISTLLYELLFYLNFHYLKDENNANKGLCSKRYKILVMNDGG